MRKGVIILWLVAGVTVVTLMLLARQAGHQPPATALSPTPTPDPHQAAPPLESPTEALPETNPIDVEPPAQLAAEEEKSPASDPGIPTTLDGVDAMPALSLASQVARMVRQLQNNTTISLDQYGRHMLTSTNPVLRAIGGILMFKANALDETLLLQIAQDGDLSVPFMVLEWIRDYGSADLAMDMAKILQERGLDADVLSLMIRQGAFSAGGGRAALDVLLTMLSPDDATVLLDDLSTQAELDYDVRMKSVLLMRDYVAQEEYLATLRSLQETEGQRDSDWVQAVTRLAERLRDSDEETPVSRDLVSSRDLNLILGNDYPTAARDAALYLEDKLLRPSVVVESGSAQVVSRFLKEFPESARTWNVEDEVVMQRLETLLERLTALESPAPDPPVNEGQPILK